MVDYLFIIIQYFSREIASTKTLDSYYLMLVFCYCLLSCF